MSKRYLVFIFLLYLAPQAWTQSLFNWNKNPELRETFVRTIGQYGTLLRRNTGLLANPDSNGKRFQNSLGIHLEFGWQTKGDSEWESICNFPRFGLGVQQTVFLDRNDLGNPTSFYGFLNGNFIRNKRFQWSHQLGFGLAFGFNRYDPTVNPPNEIIGSRINAYIEAGTTFSFLIGRRWSIEPGVRLTHFSNGNSKLPQKGINIFAYQLGIRHQLARQARAFQEFPKPACQHRHELYGSLGFGTRQFDFTKEDNSRPPETYGFNYLVSNLSIGYLYEVRHQLKIGGGVDFFYDGTNGADIVTTNKGVEKQPLSFGEKAGVLGFIGIEGVIDRLSIGINAGYVILRKEFEPTADFEKTTAKFQQRVGFKYHFLPQVFLGIDVWATEFHVAKVVQYKIGMRLYLKKGD